MRRESEVHKQRNSPIQERGSAGRDLLLSKVLVEEHRRIGHWPREIDILPQPLRCSHAILESAFIEHIRGKFGKAGVHAVLHLKSDRTVTKDDEALKERLCETSTSSFLVHNDRTELLKETEVRTSSSLSRKEIYLMVPNEHHLFTSQNEWNHTFWSEYISDTDPLSRFDFLKLTWFS
jgi:hypothetical protein